MLIHDTLPYVIAAYAIAWVVLSSYAVYLWRLGKRLDREAQSWE